MMGWKCLTSRSKQPRTNYQLWKKSILNSQLSISFTKILAKSSSKKTISLKAKWTNFRRESRIKINRLTLWRWQPCKEVKTTRSNWRRIENSLKTSCNKKKSDQGVSRKTSKNYKTNSKKLKLKRDHIKKNYTQNTVIAKSLQKIGSILNMRVMETGLITQESVKQWTSSKSKIHRLMMYSREK